MSASDQITPGPWEVDQNWIDNVSAEYPNYAAVSIGSSFISGHVGIANARLIAAAPNLLEAAKAISTMDCLWSSSGAHDSATCECAVGRAERAVAKAEGRS